MSSKYDIDISKQYFGKWHVLRRDTTSEAGVNSRWICKCCCGTVRSVATRQLITGKSLSCGCFRPNMPSTNRNLVGCHFGDWVVISRAPTEISEVSHRKIKMWKCRCSCGLIRSVAENSLVCGKSKSCGHLRSESVRKAEPYRDLTGQQFGYWTVLKHLPNRKTKSGQLVQYWECRCQCGKVRAVARESLLSHKSLSCGCLHFSNLERYVSKYLDKRNIFYIPQKTFPNLLGKNGKKPSFDFYIPYQGERYLIECQGEQHYHPVKFFGGKDRFLLQQQSDHKKRDFALINNFNLIYVPYYLYKSPDYSNKIDILLNSYFNSEKRLSNR